MRKHEGWEGEREEVGAEGDGRRSRKGRWRGSAICYHMYMYLHIAFPKQHT